MASFNIPQPVTSRSVRADISRQRHYYEEAEVKLKPKTELFCTKCMAKSLVKEAYGFCKICLDFLCEKCVDSHESDLMTLNHGIMVGNEMLIRYHYAMKDRKTGRKSVSRSQSDMVSNGRVSFQYPVKGSEVSKSTDDAFEAELKEEVKVRVPSDTEKCFICACVVHKDGKIILADANNKSLKLFTKHFTFSSVFRLKQEPWDMCRAVDFDNDLFVTESKIKGIHQFKVGKEIKYIFTLKVDGDCFAICHWKGGIAVSVKKDGTFSVQLLDQFGNVHQSIKDGFDGQLKMKTPWYLTASHTGEIIIISDMGKGTVSSINVEKGVKFIFKDRKELRDPRNVSVDEDGNIFVVDYETDTVHQLTRGGKSLGVILCRVNGLENPCGMACHKERLYIQAKMDSTFMKIFELH